MSIGSSKSFLRAVIEKDKLQRNCTHVYGEEQAPDITDKASSLYGYKFKKCSKCGQRAYTTKIKSK
jgi:hydrogenase maturation factor HypF (carbamoyltransferase family)